ncbi:MAG: ABC transporter permease subunit [Bacillota bacterium]|nr:ABC transporter permease subunit [Bacillota bacterium]
MNIFLRELKAHRKSLIIWCICMVFLIAASMGKYEGLSSSGQSMSELLNDFPKSLKAIFGMGTFDIAKVSGYFAVMFLFIQLMAAVHAAMLGADIISKEERDKTSEFLFVKPVSRTSIISSKLSAALVNVVILNLVTFISSLALVGKYSKGEAVSGDITKLMIGMFIVQLIFMSVGSGIAAISKNPKTATAVSTGILLTTFILAELIDVSGKIDFLKFLTPFKYFSPDTLMYGGAFGLGFLAFSVLIIAVTFGMTYKFFSARDLRI